MTFAQLIRIFMAVTMATQGAGQAMSRAPSAMRATRATRSVYHLIDLVVSASSNVFVVPYCVCVFGIDIQMSHNRWCSLRLTRQAASARCRQSFLATAHLFQVTSFSTT